MTKFSLILVPYELGRLRAGVGCGPEKLLASGAKSVLTRYGADLETHTIALGERWNGSGHGEADAGFELMRQVAESVREAREREAFPIILSGSCFNAVGVVAGMAEANPGVVWFDAHSDFSEPATTESGYLDSMGLSILTGSAWQAMLGTVPGARPVPETSVILAGARVFDPCEERRLAASRIALLSPEDLGVPGPLLKAVRELTPRVSGLYVHIDLDVLDKAVASVNVYSAPRGVSAESLPALIEALSRETPVRALTLSAYDPSMDTLDQVPPIALNILDSLARHFASSNAG